MSDKKDSYSARQVPFNKIQWPEDGWEHSAEWHLEFGHMPDFPYPFPIVPAGTRDKHDAVGHLSADGGVHVYCTAIIEQLVRAGLRARVAGNGTKSGNGHGGQKPESSK
jgi:hypothetical protein